MAWASVLTPDLLRATLASRIAAGAESDAVTDNDSDSDGDCEPAQETDGQEGCQTHASHFIGRELIAA